MRVITNRIFKVAVLITLFYLAGLHGFSQSVTKSIQIDTAALSIRWDSLLLRMNKDIRTKDYWMNILSQDTCLIAFFKSKTQKEPYYFYISSIERTSEIYIYGFAIYSRPINLDVKNLESYGEEKYLIEIAPQINNKPPKIISIKRIGIARI